MVGWGFHKKKESIPVFYDFQLVWWLTLLPSYRSNVGCQIMENLYYSFRNLDYYRINWLVLIVWENHTEVIINVGRGIDKEIGNILDFYDFQVV